MNNITKILLFIMFFSFAGVGYSQSTPKRNSVSKAKKDISKRRKTRAKNTAKSQKMGKKRFEAMQTKNTIKMMKRARKNAERRRKGKPTK